MAEQYQVIGKAENRKDAWSKATGSALYTADIPVAGLSWGLIVRSPHHHARILKIDKSSAERMPGIKAILGSDDIPGAAVFGALVSDQPSLARNVVRHLGEPVLLVIAESRELAQAASEKILITYEPLPSVFDPVKAAKPDAPKVHEGGNILSELHMDCGDLAAGFSAADQIVEDTYQLPRISPGYMEPETSLAVWEDDETITVWVSSQHPFTDQSFIAAALDLPLDRIRVKSAVIGGAFGGKEDSSLAILAALGAWAIKGKIKIVNSRRESFLAHPKRHPAQIRYKIGAKADGTITAMEAEVYMDTGAYSSYGPAVAMILTETLSGSYRIPNVKIDTYVVYTNSPLSGAMRGFGSPQAHFAVESALDTLAEKLDLDPIQIREVNILKAGGSGFYRCYDRTTRLTALPICLENARAVMKLYKEIDPAPGKIAGVGMALAAQTMGLGANVPDDSTHRLEWAPDGRILIHLGLS